MGTTGGAMAWEPEERLELRCALGAQLEVGPKGPTQNLSKGGKTTETVSAWHNASLLTSRQ
ncbi:MAG: hypothetical protein JO115_05425 [Pseudonocardiales bacterium]|nr:hypothetical protein [Pseudonocardiales bacterium]